MMRRRRVKLSATQLMSRNCAENLVDKDNHACDGSKYVLMTRPEPTVKTREELIAERAKQLADVGDLTAANIRCIQAMEEMDEDEGPSR